MDICNKGKLFAFITYGFNIAVATFSKAYSPNSAITNTCVGVGLFVSALYSRPKSSPLILFRTNILLVAICEACDLFCFLECVQYIPIGLAIAFNQSTPVYSLILELLMEPKRFPLKTKILRCFCGVGMILGLYGYVLATPSPKQTFYSFLFLGNNTDNIQLGVALATLSSIFRVFLAFICNKTQTDEQNHHWVIPCAVTYLVIFAPLAIRSPSANDPTMWLKGGINASFYTALCTFAFMSISLTEDIAPTTYFAIRKTILIFFLNNETFFEEC